MDDANHLIPGPNDSPSVGGSDSPRGVTPVASGLPKSSTGESGEPSIRVVCRECFQIISGGAYGSVPVYAVCLACFRKVHPLRGLMMLFIPSALLFLVLP